VLSLGITSALLLLRRVFACVVHKAAVPLLGAVAPQLQTRYSDRFCLTFV